MFELTNEQRKCFALVPVSNHWERIELKPSPYDQFLMSKPLVCSVYHIVTERVEAS